MAARANKPVSVTLGPLAKEAEKRVKAGKYASISEVVRAGLRALEREDELFEQILRAKVAEALADPRPPISSDQLESDMRAWRDERLKSGS